jgi:UDP-N-acetylmuramoylalanine--D-glutamate ligase
MPSFDFSGLRVAVAGLGVSGQAAALAIQARGGDVTALDEKPGDSGPQLQAVDRLTGQGVKVITGWPGRLDSREFDLLIVSPGIRINHPVMQDMAGKVWGEVELAWQISRAPLMAVTGTNGKSTVTVLTWLLLNAEGKKAKLCGNIAGSGFPEMALTQAASEAEPDQILASEISSFQLETVHEFRPFSAGITVITPDHLDRHASYAEYRRCKLKLVQKMGMGDRVVAPLHVKDPLAQDLFDLAPNATHVSFDPTGRQKGENSVVYREGATLVLGGHKLEISDLQVPGEHFVANVMMAWELASAFTQLGAASIAALREFKGLNHRMELVGEKQGVKVINNSMCTNPGAAAASILALAATHPGRQHLIMGGSPKNMGEEEFEPLRQVLRETDCVVRLIGPNPDFFRTLLGVELTHFDSLDQAFADCTAKAERGEVIMLAPACASTPPFANFKERGDAFKSIANQWLEAQ